MFGSELGAAAPIEPVFEMTWAAWRTLHPDTSVVSSNTGHTRDYQAYPYGPYRTDDTNTFRPTDPPADPRFGNKDMVFGLVVDDTFVAYPWSALESSVGGRRGVVRDTVAGTPVAIVFDLDERYVHAFDASSVDLSLVP